MRTLILALLIVALLPATAAASADIVIPREGQVIEPGPYMTVPISLSSYGFVFTTTSDVASTECRLDDAAFTPCQPPNSPGYSCVAMGPHTVQLRATDDAGNVTVQTRHFTLSGWWPSPSCAAAPEPDPDVSDTPAATVSFTGGIAAGAWSSARDVTVAFSAAGAECAADAGAFTACAGSFTATALADGTHSISVRAGGQTAVRRFRVDATAPNVALAYGPAEGAVIAFVPTQFMPGPMSLGDDVIAFLVDEAHVASVQCRFDDEAFGRCDGGTTYSEFYNCLPNGTHTFYARATDKAGNVTTVARTFTLSGWAPWTGTSPWRCTSDGHTVHGNPPPSGGGAPIDGGPAVAQDLGATPQRTALPTIPAPRLSFVSRNTRAWTKLRALKLVDVPKGAKVTVSCTGCKGKVRKLSDVTGRKLKPGTRVTIKVAARTIRITIRAGRAPLIAT